MKKRAFCLWIKDNSIDPIKETSKSVTGNIENFGSLIGIKETKKIMQIMDADHLKKMLLIIKS